MTTTGQQGLRQDDQAKNEKSNLNVGKLKLGQNLGLTFSIFFAGLPFEGGRFSPKLSIAMSIVGSVLKQRQYPVNTQAHPILFQQTYHPCGGSRDILLCFNWLFI